MDTQVFPLFLFWEFGIVYTRSKVYFKPPVTLTTCRLCLTRLHSTRNPVEMTVNLGDSPFKCNFAPFIALLIVINSITLGLLARSNRGLIPAESRESLIPACHFSSLLFFPHSPELRLQQLQSGRQFQKRRVNQLSTHPPCLPPESPDCAIACSYQSSPAFFSESRG